MNEEELAVSAGPSSLSAFTIVNPSSGYASHIEFTLPEALQSSGRCRIRSIVSFEISVASGSSALTATIARPFNRLITFFSLWSMSETIVGHGRIGRWRSHSIVSPTHTAERQCSRRRASPRNAGSFRG
jgi:hypothetical protein